MMKDCFKKSIKIIALVIKVFQRIMSKVWKKKISIFGRQRVVTLFVSLCQEKIILIILAKI